jgi:tetratricopeptide (TPR) repeat protein
MHVETPPRQLIERERELAALAETIRAAESGTGAAVLLEGAAGIGKTELLRHARVLAAGRGLRVLSARGSELGRDFPFGVVRQLLQPVLRRLDDGERSAVLAGAARDAAPLLGFAADAAGPAIPDPRAPVPERSLVVIHALFWLLAELSAAGPLLLAIDDAHWIDPASGRFLDYVVTRLEELPVAVVMASRPLGADSALPASDPSVPLVELHPLSLAAVGDLVAAHTTHQPDPGFTTACHTSTGGNPFLVREVLTALAERQLAPVEELADELANLVSGSASRSILRRIERLGAGALALVKALAVLGGEGELHHAAQLSGLSTQEADQAADALAAGEIVHRGRPLAFRHPLVLAAARTSLGPAEAARGHARAARLLAEQGADVRVVAAHLLHGEPSGDPWAIDILGLAAREAVAEGATEEGIALLRRAMREPPRVESRAGILLELGLVESRAGAREATETLARAFDCAGDTRGRVAAAVALGRTLVLSERTPEAVEAYARAAPAVSHDDAQLALMVDAAGTGAAQLDARTAQTARAGAARLRAAADAGDVPRNVTAVLAFEAALTNEPAAQFAEPAACALARDPLVPDIEDAPIFYHACAALLWAERYEEVRRLYDDALAESRLLGASIRFGGTATFRAWLELRAGSVSEAELHARAAVETTQPLDQRLFVPMSAAMLVMALVERGDTASARAELDQVDADGAPTLQRALLRHSRGRLALAEQRADEALSELSVRRPAHPHRGAFAGGGGVAIGCGARPPSGRRHGRRHGTRRRGARVGTCVRDPPRHRCGDEDGRAGPWSRWTGARP